MTAVVLVALGAAGWLVVQILSGGWRRLFVRARWASLCRQVGAAVRRDRLTSRLPGPGERVSSLAQVERLPRLIGVFGRPVGPVGARMGASWRVWSAAGQTTAELAEVTDRLAAATWCRRAVLDVDSPRAARLTLLWSDPLAEVRGWYPPTVGVLRPGWDVHGRPIEVPILDPWGGGWLVGAASGSGKSAWVNTIIAGLAAQPAGTVQLVGIDPKVVELQPWRRAMLTVATDTAAADRVLDTVRRFIDSRTAELAAAGLRTVPLMPSTRWPYVALVIDELGALLSGSGPAVERRRAILGEVAMLGRAAGVVLVVATQRPTVELIPGQLRDNLQRRVLLRVPTIEAGRATLGWAPTQAMLDALDRPGVAWLDIPGRRPVLCRSTYGTVADAEHAAMGVAA